MQQEPITCKILVAVLAFRLWASSTPVETYTITRVAYKAVNMCLAKTQSPIMAGGATLRALYRATPFVFLDR